MRARRVAAGAADRRDGDDMSPRITARLSEAGMPRERRRIDVGTVWKIADEIRREGCGFELDPHVCNALDREGFTAATGSAHDGFPTGCAAAWGDRGGGDETSDRITPLSIATLELSVIDVARYRGLTRRGRVA
jgi:hypothetical protein